MAASAPLPKDLPREAEANLDEQQHLNLNHGSGLSDAEDDHDNDEDEYEDVHDAHDQLHGHSHAHGHEHQHGAHSHAHADDGDRPHVRFSQTPMGGIILNVLQSIPLVTSVLLRLLPLTNAVAFILAAAHLLAQPDSAPCSVSLLGASGAADWSRVLLSLFFDDSYASFFASLFAVYELGSRLETLKSSLHFLLLCIAYVLAASTAYYYLLLWVPALAVFPCSVGCWPVVIALAVTESLHNRLAPRSFPLFPYPIPPLAFPTLLLLAHQLLFAVHPFPILALPLAYVLHWPLHAAVRGLSGLLERGWCASWLGGRSGYVSVAKAGSMPPWAPIINFDEPTPVNSAHTSPEPILVSDMREPRVNSAADRKSPRKLVNPQPPPTAAESSDDGEDEWKDDADIEIGSIRAHTNRSEDRTAEEHTLLQSGSTPS